MVVSGPDPSAWGRTGSGTLDSASSLGSRPYSWSLLPHPTLRLTVVGSLPPLGGPCDDLLSPTRTKTVPQSRVPLAGGNEDPLTPLECDSLRAVFPSLRVPQVEGRR